MQARRTPAVLRDPERVAAVRRIVSAGPAGDRLDSLTRLAATLLDAPQAQVELLTQEPVSASVHRGEGLPDGPGEAGTHGHGNGHGDLCAATVARGEPLVIDGAGEDVVSVSVPLVGGAGLVLGALTVCDRGPRRWKPKDVVILRQLGERMVVDLEARAAEAEREAELERSELALAAAQVGRFDLHLATSELLWDEQLITMFGYERESFTQSMDSFYARVHPDDRERVAVALARAVEAVGEFNAEYRIVWPDGRLRWIEARGRVLADMLGRPVRLLGAARDSTALRESRDQVARVLETMTNAFYRLDRQWRLTYVNAEAELILQRDREQLLGRSLWAEFPETVGSELEEQYRLAVETGERVAFEFFYPTLETWFEVRAWPEPDGLSVYFHDVNERRAADEQRGRALAQAEAAQGRLALLAEASTRLSASLEPAAVLRALSDLVVPRFGQWLVLALREEEAAPLLGQTPPATDGGGVRVVHVAHAVPARAEALAALVAGIPVSMDDAHGVGRVVASGRPEWLPDVSDEALVALAPDSASLQALRTLDLHAALTVPLVSRGRTLGALTIAEPQEGHLNQSMLADVATRAASALDNALLFGAQRTIGLTLQRSLLPPEAAQLPSIEVATRYLPATEGALAGGDFHQVVRVGNRLMVALGDVAGHGMQSAARMGQLRAIVAALALEGHPPGELLTRVAAYVDRLLDLPLATVLVGLYDPANRSLELATAGHPPPLLGPLDGAPYFYDLDPGPPLGVGEFDYDQRTVTVPAGATLVLYSDGLIERRDETLTTGMERLRRALIEVRLPPEAVADHVLRKLDRADGADDDVALLVLSHLPDELQD